MTPATPVFDALCEAAIDGVDFDGLRLETTADRDEETEPAGAEETPSRGDDVTYILETPTLERTGLSERDLRRTLASVREYATNWYYWRGVGGEGTARRAFLQWCERAPREYERDQRDQRDDEDERDERVESDVQTAVTTAEDECEPLAVPDRYEALADGIDREWGQLLVTTELADDPTGIDTDRDATAGERIYHLRHVDDTQTSLEDLETYDRPREARDLATSDDRGRYRPLKTAPTLVSGWAFPDLTGADLVETIGFLYPATIANWHRERRGDLDVDHWLETADRQSGIYEVVDELPRDAVEWLTEACCVDSQCLRRREWHYEEGDELETPGGSGEFPCREPCSLVIAAARQWAILETETEHTWEFELTTSEKNQLEALIDAVAEGRIDEIREADLSDGANRYRARYLRAKRFDDDGTLCGVDQYTDSKTD